MGWKKSGTNELKMKNIFSSNQPHQMNLLLNFLTAKWPPIRSERRVPGP